MKSLTRGQLGQLKKMKTTMVLDFQKMASYFGPSRPPQAPSALPSIIMSLQANIFRLNLTSLPFLSFGIENFVSFFGSVLEMNEPRGTSSNLLLSGISYTSVPSMNNSSKPNCLLCSIWVFLSPE